MDALSAAATVISIFSLSTEAVFYALDIYLRTLTHVVDFSRLYGPSGLVLLCFGSRTTWRVEAQVLGQLDAHGKVDDLVAMDFRKSVQDECTMISTAAAITAQIAITALSLSSLSQTHWIVRGFSVFSLISSLMAVYYATTQHRTLGRLLSAVQVRTWIRGGVGMLEQHRLVPSLGRFLSAFPRYSIFDVWLAYKGILFSSANMYHLCDPEELDEQDLGGSGTDDPDEIKYSLMRQCFVPSVASVITMSAPQMLLSASLIALLLALGIYLGFIWTRNLDTDAGLNDSRNVFIMYIVGLVVCILVYSISQLIQNEDSRSEQKIIEDYMMKFMEKNPEVLRKLKIRVVEDEKKVVLIKIVEQTSSQE